MALPRKRKKPRRTRTPRCKKQRCNKAASLAGMCKTHATREADRLFSLDIRGYGDCYAKTEFWMGPEFKCAGPLQCCHLISRRYRNTRWHKKNAVSMCAAHHRWFDTHPLEREDMVRNWLGCMYEELHDLALSDADWRESMLEWLDTPSGAEESDGEVDR